MIEAYKEKLTKMYNVDYNLVGHGVNLVHRYMLLD